MYTELIIIGILLIIIGFIIVLIGILSSMRGESRVEGGGVILIGPIPILFASNTRIAVILMILAIVLIVATYLLFYYQPLR